MTPGFDTRLHALNAIWPFPEESEADGIDGRWRQSLLAQRLADLLARVAIGDRIYNLPPLDRAFFNKLAEDTVARSVDQYAHFTEASEPCQSGTSTPTTTTNTTARTDRRRGERRRL